MTEIFRPIFGYEGKYEVSNLGNVKSYLGVKPRLLTPVTSRNGYLNVVLCGLSRRRTSVHRLVAETFIDNPKCLSDVNHIDEDKTNNNVDNLEWLSHIDNMNHGTINKRKQKPIYAINLNSGLDHYFESVKECANELGLHGSAISHCINGKYKQTGGYYFETL